MLTQIRIIFATLALIMLPLLASAQTQIPFGGLKHDASLPVEMLSDSLQINQADGSAVFSGNVIISQGDMRISAGLVLVEYSQTQDERRISLLRASGGVILVNGTEAAESETAVYSIDNSSIVMTGNVILTQGQSTLSAASMSVNLKTGQATLQGRVKTIFQTGDN